MNLVKRRIKKFSGAFREDQKGAPRGKGVTESEYKQVSE